MRRVALVGLLLLAGCLAPAPADTPVVPDPSGDEAAQRASPCFEPDRPAFHTAVQVGPPTSFETYGSDQSPSEGDDDPTRTVFLPSEAKRTTLGTDRLDLGFFDGDDFALLVEPSFAEAVLFIAATKPQDVPGGDALDLVGKGCVPLHNLLATLVHEETLVHVVPVGEGERTASAAIPWTIPRPADGTWVLVTSANDEQGSAQLGGSRILLQPPSMAASVGRTDVRAEVIDAVRATSACWEETTLQLRRPICPGAHAIELRVFSGEASYAVRSFTAGVSTGVSPLRFCSSAQACIPDAEPPVRARYEDVRVAATASSATFSWAEVDGAEPFGAKPHLMAETSFPGHPSERTFADPPTFLEGRWTARLDHLAAGQTYTYTITPALNGKSTEGRVNGTFQTLSAELLIMDFAILQDDVLTQGCLGFSFRTEGPGLHFPFVAVEPGLPPTLPVQGRWNYWQPRDGYAVPATTFTGRTCGLDRMPDMPFWAVAQMTVNEQTIDSPVTTWRTPADPSSPFGDFVVTYLNETAASVAWTFRGTPDWTGMLRFGQASSVEHYAPYHARDEANPQTVLDGLTPGATYLYRVSNASDGVQVFSNEQRFTMPPTT